MPERPAADATPPPQGEPPPAAAAPPRPPALDPAEPLGALDEVFHDAYAARREAVLARMEPLIANIDDRLILRRGGQRFEGPSRTRRYHQLKAISHVPLCIHMILAGRRGALDDGARGRLTVLRERIDAAAGSLEHCGFGPEELARLRGMLEPSRAFVEGVIGAGSVTPEALAGFIGAQTPAIERNMEEAARDQIETMHATVEAWRRDMSPEERDALRVVVGVSHMARPGSVAVQYFSVTLGESWEGRFEQEEMHAGKRVLASETACDEAAAFALLATHALDARVATRFFGEESRMERDVLGDPAERILARMFHKEPAPTAQASAETIEKERGALMTDNAKNTTSTVIPTMRYRDAPAAIEWLCRAFGFEKHLVVPGEEEGTIAHAQLRFGNGMIMLGSARDDEFGKLIKPPRDLGGVGSQSAYVIVEDANAHYARAVAAGAEIIVEIKDEDYGGRGYACKDPEGHLWNFGSYDPWAKEPSGST